MEPPSVVVIPGVAEKVRRQGEIQAEVPQRFVVKAISMNSVIAALLSDA